MPQPTSFALSEANQRRLGMVAPGLLERVRAHVHLPETTVTWSSAVCRQLVTVHDKCYWFIQNATESDPSPYGLIAA